MNITIKSITTEHISSSPFAGIVSEEYLDNTPYYSCTIVSNVATVYGSGLTEYAAEQAAIRNLEGAMVAEVFSAVARYNVAMGAGNLEIA